MTLLTNALARLFEGRLPQTPTLAAATTSKNGVLMGGGVGTGPGLAFGSGVQAQLAAYAQSGWLFSVIDRIIAGVTAPEWKLYRKPGAGSSRANKGKRQEVERHPALNLWQQPNPFYDRAAFLAAGQQHMELLGETWWHIVFAGRVPVEL